MFCENCGKQIPDGSAFCDGCGAKLTQATAPAAPDPATAPVAAPAAPAKAPFFATLLAKAKAIHQKNKLIFPIAGAVAVVAIALIIVFSILGKQVSVKDYVNITVEGYDGYGYVYIDFGHTSFGMRVAGDKDVEGYDEELEEDGDFRYMEKGDVPKECRDNFKDAQKLVDSVELKEITYPEDKGNGSLSNGDVIKIEIKCNENRAEDLGLTLHDLTFEYTVEGLKPVAEFDVLSYFDLVGEGYDGYGDVKLVCNYTGTKQVGDLIFDMEEGKSYISYGYEEDGEYDYSIYPYIDSDTYNKSNGDTVKVTINYSDDAFIEYGVKLVNQEKEYTVSDLKETEKVDLLAYYTIEFTGLDGSGRPTATPTAEVVTIGDYEVNLQTGEWYKGDENVAYTSVYFSDSYGLTNGDQIKVYVSFSEYTFSELGIKFVNTEKDVTVSNLATYVTDLAKVTDYSKVEEEVKNRIVDHLNESWSWVVHGDHEAYHSQVIGEDMKLYKTVLKISKSSNSYNKNQLFMVFTVTLSDNALSPTVYYIPFSITNAAVYGDGTLSDYELPFSRHLAYTSYDELYQEAIDNDTYLVWEITESEQF